MGAFRMMAAITLTLLLACGCADQRTPGYPMDEQLAFPPTLDSANATVASANAAPMSSAPAMPLPRTTLQPSLPEIEAGAGTVPPAMPRLFSAVTVSLDDHAQQLASTDPRLNVIALAEAVERELQSQALLAPGSSAPTLQVTVEDLSSDLASDTRVFGFSFRNVLLIGEVGVAGPGMPPAFAVHARLRLGSHSDGRRADFLEPLFRRFAQLVAADLRGVEPPAP